MMTNSGITFKEACNAFASGGKNQFGKMRPQVSQNLIERQIAKQTRHHKHKGYNTDIRITAGVTLKGFRVDAGVMRPEIMTSVFLARYMFFENGQYRGGRALDMGCGSGIIGAVMALNGAKSVVFSDVSKEALENTRENTRIFGIESKSRIVASDLFENIRGKFNLIEFNHPFFSDLRLRAEAINSAMIQPATLIHRFFEDAKKHLLPRGKIIMPYYHIAGEANDPG
ncbi:MAG TPA: methyltransferase, partial [Candidatus Micrarchaeota archaeon]|nr:methyltransferase [Candidatus Micrarchaeota archaeon]